MRSEMRSLYAVFQYFEGGAHRGEWWYSTVHLTTTIIGAGILALPSAMVYLGWWGGMLMLSISYIITLSTLWQMVNLHHCEEGQERIIRYQELGRYAFGPRGWYTMLVIQMLLQVSVNIIYMITAGYAISLIFPRLEDFGAILVFAAAQFFVGLIPNFPSLTWVSTLAMIMSIGYSVIIWGSAIHLRNPDASYSIPKEDRIPKMFNAFGQIAFAYGGQNVAMEIQSMMRAPSTRAMWHGVLVTYVVIAVCYFPVAALGYWAIGNMTCYDNVLWLLHSDHLPRWVFYTANTMLVLHLTGSYQVYALPVYETLEPVFRRLSPSKGFLAFVLARYCYIVCTCFIAILLPFFKEIMGIIGGLAIAPTAYFVPCIMWLAIRKPEPFSLSWLANMVCIVFGVILTILAIIGSIWNITISMKSKTHEVFHFLQRNLTCTI